MEAWDEFKYIQDAEFKTLGDDVDYRIEVIDGGAVLSFQETTSRADWKNNFNIKKISVIRGGEELLLHKGYFETWQKVSRQILAEFREAVSVSNKWPRIIGWSYGGAMAILAAMDFHDLYSISCDVHTFGAPMVAGNKAAKDYIDGNAYIYQYAIKNDVVPLCPPLPGYRHINKIKIGLESFNILKLFHPEKYHYLYGNKEQYVKKGRA